MSFKSFQSFFKDFSARVRAIRADAPVIYKKIVLCEKLVDLSP